MRKLLKITGVLYEELENLFNYIYQGEVNIKANDYNRFLTVAKELKITGLTEEKYFISNLPIPQKNKNVQIKNSLKRQPLLENSVSNASNLIDLNDIKQDLKFCILDIKDEVKTDTSKFKKVDPINSYDLRYAYLAYCA